MEREQTTIRLPAELKERLQQEADRWVSVGSGHRINRVDSRLKHQEKYKIF